MIKISGQLTLAENHNPIQMSSNSPRIESRTMKRNTNRMAMVWLIILFAAQIWGQSEVIVERQSAPIERADRFFSSNGNFIGIDEYEINFFDSNGKHKYLEPIRKADYAPSFSHTASDSQGKYFAHAYKGYYPSPFNIVGNTFHGIVFNTETSEVIGTHFIGKEPDSSLISQFNQYVSFSPDDKSCAISGYRTTVISLDNKTSKGYNFPIYRLMNNGMAFMRPQQAQPPSVIRLQDAQTISTWFTLLPWNEIEHLIVGQKLIGYAIESHSLIIRDLHTGIVNQALALDDFGPYPFLKIKRHQNGKISVFGIKYSGYANSYLNIIYSVSSRLDQVEKVFSEPRAELGFLMDLDNTGENALMENRQGGIRYRRINLLSGESFAINSNEEPGITRNSPIVSFKPFIVSGKPNEITYRSALDNTQLNIPYNEPELVVISASGEKYTLRNLAGPSEVFEFGSNRPVGKLLPNFAPDLGSSYRTIDGRTKFFRINENQPWLSVDETYAVAFSRNGKFVLTMHLDGKGTYPYIQRFSVYCIHTGAKVSSGYWLLAIPSSITVSDDGRYAAFGWDAFSAYGGFWQYYAGKHLCLVKLTPSAQVIPIDWDNSVSSLIFSPTGNKLYSIGGGKALAEINCDTYAVDRTYKIQSHDWNDIKFLDISRDGRKFVIDRGWSSDATIRLPD